MKEDDCLPSMVLILLAKGGLPDKPHLTERLASFSY